jgi:hypothetical protein
LINSEKNTRKEKFKRGDALVSEPTGSASMINLDGQWEHDFVDDPTPAGLDHKKSVKNE